jgi:hypothetical protein
MSQAVTHIWESWWLESMYTLQGKPDQHASHAQSAYGPRPYVSHAVNAYNLSHSRQQSWAGPLLPRKKGSWPNPQHDGWSICRSVPSFSPKTTIETVGEKPTLCWWPTTRLFGPISLACDRYVQYLLAGANPSVLNQHRRGLQPWTWRLSTSHCPTFPTDGPPLST